MLWDLRRQLTAAKRVWFLTPTVVLAQQQYRYLSTQLPVYGIRLITGSDNVESWSTQPVWNKVLDNIDIVVATAQILVDALAHGFVKIHQISLLVFDEAHHCSRKHAMAKIMQHHGDARRARDGTDLPHILGLTASPVTATLRDQTKLEEILHARCVTPTRHLEEFLRHVYKPSLEQVIYTKRTMPYHPMVHSLATVTSTLQLSEDPRVRWLEARSDELSRSKLSKIQQQGRTPVIKEFQSLLSDAYALHDDLGSWVSSIFIKACFDKLQCCVQGEVSIISTLYEDEHLFIHQKMSQIMLQADCTPVPQRSEIAEKAAALIRYLVQNWQSGMSTIIFVKRRSVAWALTVLLRSAHELQQFHVFSFVGMASAAGRSLRDLADMQLQNDAFADFRSGRCNVCVATQVMEEGIDVQAVNLVVRFDEPDSLRSYIQSRGRARHPNSKLVMVREHSDNVLVAQEWQHLEDEMRKQCAQIDREIADRTAVESQEETCTEVYKVHSTGAVLTYDNARSHVQHYCDKIPRHDSSGLSEPIITVSGTIGHDVSARVQLPSYVAPILQVSTSLRKWRTERAAVKDACFQCYRKLHTAGLVNDNLLPIYDDVSIDHERHDRHSMHTVQQEMSPWQLAVDVAMPSTSLHAHEVRLEGEDLHLPNMLLLLPQKLDHQSSFMLRSTPYGDLFVTISPEPPWVSGSLVTAMAVTKHLLRTILGRRLKNVDLDERLPFLFIPYLPSEQLEQWGSDILQHPRPLLANLDDMPSQRQPCLIKVQNEEILYSWTPSLRGPGTVPPESIQATRLTRQLNFLVKDSTAVFPDSRELIASECCVEPLPLAYGQWTLFLPSILFKVGIALRAQSAVYAGGLQAIGFSNSQRVVEALTNNVASPECNYDRLEFLGDALLKFHATVQVYFDHPLLPEGALSSKRRALLSNARLCHIAQELNLDACLSLRNFSARDWTLKVGESNAQKREVSSKTLADVIEALLGAAFLETREQKVQTTSAKQDLLLAALQHFLPEVTWSDPGARSMESPVDNNDHVQFNMRRLAEVESMLKYEFRNKNLLAEALTQTSLRSGLPSYGRLEFLGDAVLDRVVSVALFDGMGPAAEAQHLTLAHHALVNHYFLAYLGLRMTQSRAFNQVDTERGHDPVISASRRVLRLIDYVTRTPDKAILTQRDQAEETFIAHHEHIDTAIKSSRTFPITLLQTINTNKIYSDIIESVLGAVFIDSHGDLQACEQVLETIGLMSIMRRIITAANSAEPIDVAPPLGKLLIMYPQMVCKRSTSGQISRGTKKWKTTFALDDEELASCRSEVNKDHADNLAAEMAFEVLKRKREGAPP